MEPEFIRAISDWLQFGMAESNGPGTRGGLVYSSSQALAFLQHHLPDEAAQRIYTTIVSQRDNYGDTAVADGVAVLSDVDAGLLMQAGASKFIRIEAD